MIDLAVILRVMFFVLIVLFQILIIPVIIAGYSEFWKTGQKKMYILLIGIIFLMLPIIIGMDLFFLDIFTGKLPVSAIWEIK